MDKKTSTIKDVAKAAGVSTATVSRALSNPELLAENTRKAVLDAIRATGYRVNQAARSLRSQKAGAVMVVVPDLGNQFFSEILSGISRSFSETDVSVLIVDSSFHADIVSTVLDNFGNTRIDGMISLDGNLSPDQLLRLETSDHAGQIVFACEWVHGMSLPSVRSDNETGARLAVRHLYDLGHRKIAHVTGPAGNVLTRERRQGVVAERERLGLPVHDDWIIRGDFSLQSGCNAAERILGMEDRPTAVFCASDMVAIGLISTLTQNGVRVPEDISVVGFDDIEIAEFAVPSLTTIRQERHTIGSRAAQRLLQRLDGGKGPLAPAAGPGEAVDLIDVTLIPRQSTAPARDQAHNQA